MPEEEKIPTTIREVGIHIGYLRTDMAEMKETIKEMAKNSPTRREFDELEERVSLLEAFVDGVNKKIAGAAITILVLMELARYGLDKFFHG